MTRILVDSHMPAALASQTLAASGVLKDSAGVNIVAPGFIVGYTVTGNANILFEISNGVAGDKFVTARVGFVGKEAVWLPKESWFKFTVSPYSTLGQNGEIVIYYRLIGVPA